MKKVLIFTLNATMFFGWFCVGWMLTDLTRSTIRRNDMQSIESLIQVCKDVPQFCNKAGKIWHKGI